MRPVGSKKFLRLRVLEPQFGMQRWCIPDPMRVKPHSGETLWMSGRMTTPSRSSVTFHAAICKQFVLIERKISTRESVDVNVLLL